jgi:hypothetical protein
LKLRDEEQKRSARKMILVAEEKITVKREGCKLSSSMTHPVTISYIRNV